MTEIGSTGVSATELILRCHANCPQFSANSRDICIMTQQEAASSCREMSNGFRLPSALEMATLMNPSGLVPWTPGGRTQPINDRLAAIEFDYTSSTYNPENTQGAPAAGIMTLQTLHNHAFWTDSLNADQDGAYLLNAADGAISLDFRDQRSAAWCVTERPRSAIRFNGLY
jgi:hypothetical protein